MIKLACNYYPEVIELIQEKRIELDLIKFPALGYQFNIFDNGRLDKFEEFINQVSTICPVMLHGLGPTKHNIGSPTFIEDLKIDIAQSVISMCGVNGVSLHIEGDNESLTREELKSIYIGNIRYLKEIFKNVEFLAFENVDRHPYKAIKKYATHIDPDFIFEVIEETKVHFLLDISHAYFASKCLNMDFNEYVNRLPLHRLSEIHLNGWVDTGKEVMAHIKINEEGYEMIEKVLSKHIPQIVTIEYGRPDDRLGLGIPLMQVESINLKAKEEIQEQVERIQEILNKYNK